MAMTSPIQFKSGLKLVHVYNPCVRSVAIGVFVGAGVATESKRLAGISHFIEHMVFKGTSHRTGFDIVDEIDSLGAQINAYTAKTYTCFHTVSIDSAAEKCADILSDLYFDPTFDPEELEKERRVVIEEINESEDAPDDVCLERLLSAFFKDSPLEKPILGTKKTLADMTSETLREYRSHLYVPGNTVVAIAGNMTESEAAELVIKYFESRMTPSAPAERPHLAAPERSAFVKVKKHIEQTHIAFAFPCYGYGTRELLNANLMSAIFGTEMSSRLFQSVREKLGLCYTILGYPSAYDGCGAYVIYTATNQDSALKAVRAIKGEIDRLLKEGISDAELQKGKQQLKTSLVLGQESSSSVMRAFGAHCIQTGRLYSFEERMKAIDEITKDDVLRAARYIFGNVDKVCASVVAENPDVDVLKAFKEA